MWLYVKFWKQFHREIHFACLDVKHQENLVASVPEPSASVSVYWGPASGADRSGVVGLLALRPSSVLVYLRDGSAETAARVATLRWKLQIKLAVSPSDSRTQGQLGLELTL